VRAAVVVAGIIAGQALLYGPSLVGRKLLLPVHVLAMANTYLPPSPAYGPLPVGEYIFSDEVQVYEPMRHFVASEYAAGRVPLWNPWQFCGAPHPFPEFSLFDVLYYVFPTPYILAWIQLVKALASGVGAYLVFRRVLGLRFWPAALAAWCYPLTGFLILWQGYYITYTVALYPWMLLAIDRVIRRPLSVWGPLLAILTALVLTVGAVDIAGLVLLSGGLFALWRLFLRYGSRRWRRALGAGAVLGLGVGLGIVLATPYLLPLAEYLPTGARMQQRAHGAEERPPLGIKTLPQVVLPHTYGTVRSGTYVGPSNPLEAGGSGYAGLIAVGVLAPLAWCRRRLRPMNLFWVLQAILGLAWLLDLPLLVGLFRLPTLNLMSFNRFSFTTGFAVLALAATGLDVLSRGAPAGCWWYLLPMVVVLAITLWCLDCASELPQDLRPPAGMRLSAEQAARQRAITQEFRSYHLQGLGWCAVSLVAWLLVWRGLRPRPWHVGLAGGLLAVELLIFAWDFNPQGDPAMYYPPLPPLQELAHRAPGRVLGLQCLPPLVGEFAGLRDIRGYDAVDPLRLIELLETVDSRSKEEKKRIPYAITQNYVPIRLVGPDRIPHVPPVLSMLHLRYLIGRGKAPPDLKPIIAGDDYWVWENREALPRAFIPERVEAAPDRVALLQLLASPTFDPRAIAYVEGPPALPSGCRGTVQLVEEVPTHLTLKVDMQTDGLVVLADQWYPGWEATLDGRPVPVLRVNHALRGVLLPPGQGVLEFHYHPQSFTRGVRLFGWGLAAAGIWTVVALVVRRLAARRGRSTAANP
jgi:hypothetical protein